jgi:hypothetical protein
MNRGSGSSQDVGDRPTPLEAVPADGPGPAARRLAWAAIAGIVISLLLMIGAAVIRNAWENPYIALPAAGPPWGFAPHVSYALVSGAMWAAALLGGGSLAAGLAAIARGARPSPRLLLVIALVAIVTLVVLLPTGSTDALDDAAYGRIAALGHSPYVISPQVLFNAHDPVGLNTPAVWRNQLTLYGPLATTEQWAAARLGGTSVARIIFWLKFWNAIGFAIVVLAFDRLLRSDPARRARAHLLWSVNPLLLWVLVAEGHVETLGAAVGILGLLVARTDRPAGRFAAGRWVAAGLLVGLAVDVKVTYALFGLALAWVALRSVPAFFGAAAGAIVAIAPGYLFFGAPAVRVLFAREYLSAVDSFYQLFAGSARGHQFQHEPVVGALLFLVVAVLMLWRFPGRVAGLPAIAPALAMSAAWLLFWSYSLPWYNAMAFCLLALYPASRLDWVMLAQTTAGVLALMPGNAGNPPGHTLAVINNDLLHWVAPVCLLLAAAALVWLCLTGRWKMSEPGEPGEPSARLAEVSAR